MCSPWINGEGELRGQPANPGSPGKMAVKTECVCVSVCVWLFHPQLLQVFCSITGFTNDFLSFIVVEHIRFFYRALQLILNSIGKCYLAIHVQVMRDWRTEEVFDALSKWATEISFILVALAVSVCALSPLVYQ